MERGILIFGVLIPLFFSSFVFAYDTENLPPITDPPVAGDPYTLSDGCQISLPAANDVLTSSTWTSSLDSIIPETRNGVDELTGLRIDSITDVITCVALPDPSGCYVNVTTSLYTFATPPECEVCPGVADTASVTCGDFESIIWDDLDTCDYHCDNCTTEYDAAVAACGVGNFSFDNDTCDWICSDCTDQHAAADIACQPYGIDWFDYDTCTYACNDGCDGAFTNCYESCIALNGIFKFNCTETDLPGETGIVSCECNDSSDPIQAAVESPLDPVTDPNPDPVDPDDDSGWLGAIKGNTDQLLLQNDTQTGYFNDIANNTKTTVENQSVLNDSLGSLGNKLDNLKIDVSSLDLSTLENNTAAIHVDTSDIKSTTNLIKDLLSDIKDFFTVDQSDIDSFDSTLTSSIDSAVDTAVVDMQNSVSDLINGVDSIDTDDAGFFKSLFLSVIPPNSVCEPLDLSFSGHTLIIGCEHSDDIKSILSYLVYILTVIGVFSLIHKELRPNS